MKKRKWFLYTVIIGLLPLFIRLFLFILMNKLKCSYILNEVDLITFGLVLHISNINELEDKENVDRKWKTTNIGISVFMVILFSILLAIGYICDISKNIEFRKDALKYCALFLGVASFILSYSIYNRLSTIEESSWNVQ